MNQDVPPALATPDLIARMPKVELHLHLEGSIWPETLLELASRNRIDRGIRTPADANRMYAYRDFPHFIETFVAVCEYLRRPEDFTLIVERLGDRLASQRVRYAEVHFNPEPHWRRRGIGFDRLLDAMNQGRQTVRDRHGIELRWIADGIRDAESGPISVTRTVDWMIDSGSERGIVALGLGGLEPGYPAARFAADFARARAGGFHLTAHAGETTGPEQVRETIAALAPDRIGHGIASVRDLALLTELARRRIPLEICPTSNVCTGAVGQIADLRLREIDHAGVPLTLNTDDPPMFHTSLNDEFATAAEVFGFTADDLHRFTMNAAEAAFLPPAERQALAIRLDAEYRALRQAPV